MSMIMTGK